MQKCNECDFAAFKKSNLKGHKKRHIGNFPFKCTQCDYASITQTDIVIHMRKHSGESPSNAHYAVLRPLHSKERFHKCFKCWYAFHDKRDLMRHM